MKILQISSSFFPVMGGMEKVVLETSKELIKRGHQVTVLTTDLYSTEINRNKRVLDGIKIVSFKNKFFLASSI